MPTTITAETQVTIPVKIRTRGTILGGTVAFRVNGAAMSVTRCRLSISRGSDVLYTVDCPVTAGVAARPTIPRSSVETWPEVVTFSYEILRPGALNCEYVKGSWRLNATPQPVGVPLT